jgi:hypothetical protein
MNDNSPRNQWPFGRVVEAMKSEDGKVRKVKLVTRDVQTVKVGQNGTDI